jgi:acyl-CoA synthetase (AMP-forming)/AMP-acid ligase II
MLLADIAERNARSRPGREALRFDSPGGTGTWRQLLDRGSRPANAAGSLAGPGERAAVLAENCGHGD